MSLPKIPFQLLGLSGMRIAEPLITGCHTTAEFVPHDQRNSITFIVCGDNGPRTICHYFSSWYTNFEIFTSKGATHGLQLIRSSKLNPVISQQNCFLDLRCYKNVYYDLFSMIRGIYQIGGYNIQTIKSLAMANKKQLLKYCVLIYIKISQQQVELEAPVNHILYKHV